jgi:drug/metabolite transporter (DMT)-like permease
MSAAAAQTRGLLLGLVAVVIFSVTLPVTRLAVGTPDAPQLSGVFVALSRAVLAAGLSIVYLLAVRAPWPERNQWLPLTVISLGVVLGFPICTSIALQQVEAVHASAILGMLPLSTAVIGAATGANSTGFRDPGFRLTTTLKVGVKNRMPPAPTSAPKRKRSRPRKKAAMG